MLPHYELLPELKHHNTYRHGNLEERPSLRTFAHATMATAKLPRISSIPSLSSSERAHILDLLFEPSTQLHTLSVPLLHEKIFDCYPDLISAIGIQLTELSESLSSSDTKWLHSILGSHPRLGAAKVDSAQSSSEQAQLQRGGEEAEQLRKLNAEYEAKFPGLRYVVFVNGRGRPAIMEDMRRRIDGGDLRGEEAAAIKVSITRSYAGLQTLMVLGYVRNRSRSCRKAAVNSSQPKYKTHTMSLTGLSRHAGRACYRPVNQMPNTCTSPLLQSGCQYRRV
jgi:2-oxo-4-hydroxy-4-carboxy--5-ureidoimidazoline (OHCU) decarboxylase